MHPTEIGPFRVVEVLGRGGMGTVFKAIDPRSETERFVALKLIRSDSTGPASPEFMSWRSEIEALSVLDHPGIVKLVDVGEDGSSLYLVTEFVEGKTLDRHMRLAKPGLAEVVDLARQVAQAIAYAHSRGIHHLDLKPTNIMVREDAARATVLDFGLARLSGLPGRKHDPGFSGTVRYMAPEQLDQDGSPVGAASDLYAFGCILFEMLVGRPLYSQDDVAEIMNEKSTGVRPPSWEIVEMVPTALSRMVKRSPGMSRRRATGPRQESHGIFPLA